ncbi:hypothetical protein AN958_10497 [Leucoagaricus sp. SymC.cos]|nr:hypothetical protein AN958_10497 [Leucoagaricus sp. SymC.cos]
MPSDDVRLTSIVRRSSFARHLREKHSEIRHLVTKEFLDDLEGPRILKSKNKRGRNRRSATTHEPRALVKLSGTGVHGPRRAMTVEDEIKLPKLADIGKVEDTAHANVKVGQDIAKRNQNGIFFCHFTLSLSFDFGTSFADTMSISEQQTTKYTQSPVVYQQHQQHDSHPMLESLNFSSSYLNMQMLSGTPQYEDATPGGTFTTRSVSSSPAPITPLEANPPSDYVEPAKINPYDFSIFHPEEQTILQYIPLLYSYSQEQEALLFI